ncbi:MAG: hypothetical protein Q4E74_05865 [Ruminococcus sp.]|nr:hypothetical protein [Ruminococcus sp.]
MNKSFQKSQSRRASMDSIAVPDTEKIKKLSDPKFHGSEANRQADAIFDGNRFNKVGDFDRATKFYGSIEEKRLELEKDDPDDFIPKPDPDKKAPDRMNMGVKVGSSYVKRKKVVVWIVVAFLILACALLFLPPIMTSQSDQTEVIYDRNVFENMGMTEFKTYALANYSVYSEEAFASEKKENYRVVSMNVHLQNSSPFEVSVGQFEIVRVPKAYKDKICYVTSTKTDKEGAITAETVPGFSGKDVTVEIMVNVTDMTDEQFDEAITGLILKTTDTKKRIASNTYVPSIPAFLFVSDNVSVSVNP